MVGSFRQMVGSFLRRVAVEHRAAWPLRVCYRLATAVMLVFVRISDRRIYSPRPDAERAEIARLLTVAVKTFERPREALRLISSVRQVFDGRIVVADDSRTPLEVDDPLIDVIPLPFNSGVSVGRNAALDAVDTEYVLVTDDDIVFTHMSDIGGAVAYLEDNPEVDAVGLLRVDLPRWGAIDPGADALFPGHRPPKRPHGELIGGLPVRVKLQLPFVARTEALRRVRWNENVRMLDHADFFSRASGELVCVLDPGLRAYHARTPFNRSYHAFRDDCADDFAYLRQAWDGSGLPDPRRPQ